MMFLLGTTLKVSIVVLTGLCVAFLLRRRSAAARHWTIAASLVCAMAVPVLDLVVPSWNVSLTRGAASAAVTTAVEVVPAAERAPDVSTTLDYSAAVQVPAPTAGPSSTSRFVAAGWALGTGLSLVVLVVGLARLTWLAANAKPMSDGPWVEVAGDIGRELGFARPVQLLESDHPSLLVTWGLVQPKVILPRAARAWTRERITVVLRHELAHIRRGDWVVQMAGELLRTVYWFNPLVWIACAHLRQESEQACDDEVLTSGVDGSDYASHLVDLARLLKAESAPRVPAPAIARSSSLERRIRAMLDARLSRTPSTRAARIITAAALLTFTVALAAAQSGQVAFSGAVIDPTGAPVPGAKVVLANERSRARFEVTTDAAGQFAFVPLPADTYELEATLPGFKNVQDRVTLTGRSVRRDVSLSLGELQETISVRSSSVVRLEDGTIVLPDGSKQPFKEAEFSADHARIRLAAAPNAAVLQKIVDACQPSSSGGRVRPPRKIKDVKPVYPMNLRESQTAGRVLLKATIGSDGTVRDVQVVESAHPDLDNAAIEAVRQWQFDGTLLNCSPVDVTMNVSVDFGIQ